MHIELTKKEIKQLKKLRHEIHLMGPLGTIKDMFTRSEAFGNNVAVDSFFAEHFCNNKTL